jgi:hypothetical protein
MTYIERTINCVLATVSGSICYTGYSSKKVCARLVTRRDIEGLQAVIVSGYEKVNKSEE